MSYRVTCAVRVLILDFVVDALLPLVEEYFERFATKMCCFDDLQPYLHVLNASERPSLASKMAVVCDGSSGLVRSLLLLKSFRFADSLLQDLLQSQRVINGLKIARFVSSGSSEESENAAAESYLQRYFDALPLGNSPTRPLDGPF